MKKNIIVVAIILVTITGFSLAYEKRIDSLEEAYFYTVKKLDNKENIKIEDLKELLKKYKFRKPDKTYGNEIKTVYQFANGDNEVFTIFTTKKNKDATEVIKSLGYHISGIKKTNETPNAITLSYNSEDIAKKFTYICNMNNLETFEKVSTIVDDKNNPYTYAFNKIIEDMYSDNVITLKDVEKIIPIKPVSDSHLERFDYENKGKEYKVSRNIYKNNHEDLYINYINEKNKFGRVIYSNSSNQNFDTKSAFVRDIIDMKVDCHIEGYPESTLLQEKLLNIIKKSIQ